MNLRLVGLFSLMLLGLLSCSSAPQTKSNSSLVSQVKSLPGMGWLRPVTPVNQLPTHSELPVHSEQSSETFLQGQVQQQIPLLNQWLYQLQDNTGSIWVLTTTPPPPKGQVVMIRARIHYEPVLLQGKDIGEYYAEELEQLPASAAGGS